MQQSFASSTSNVSAATSTPEDSQATRLNSQPEDNFIDFVNDVNVVNEAGGDVPSDSDDSSLMGSGSVVEETQQTTVVLPPPTQSTSPPEWGDLPPATVIKRLKQLTPEVLYSCRLREFYKSYPRWEKMVPEQKNKSLAWFRTLPVEVQGIYLFLLMFVLSLIMFSFPFFSNV